MLVLAAFSLIACLTFVAFTVDLGMITLTHTELQNVADSAAMAAVQEINEAVKEAALLAGDGNASNDVSDSNAYAEAAARVMAARIGKLNDVFIDPADDVKFGRRVYTGNGNYETIWDVSPYNVVKVTANMTDEDTEDGNAKLPLFFGGVTGVVSTSLSASATAYIEARDIVSVLDCSGSMNFDTEFVGIDTGLPKSQVEDSLDAIWDTLVDSDVRFSNVSWLRKFPNSGLGRIQRGKGIRCGYFGSSLSDSEVRQIMYWLELRDPENGWMLVPWPQEGKNSNNELNGVPWVSPYGPSYYLWRDYIRFVYYGGESSYGNLLNDYGYERYFGTRTLMAYIQRKRRTSRESEDMWMTPHYPFTAMKNGQTLFYQFLAGLQFGDHCGLVNYAASAVREEVLDEQHFDAYVDISDKPLTDNYEDLNTIQRHKQAGHYTESTNIGDGIKKGRELLEEEGRYGARPTILLMTDGQSNQYPSGFSLPGGWNWDALTDYNNDGNSDYSTSNKAKQYAFYEAKRAIDQGYTIHTISVGIGADRDLMQAIAFASGGIYTDVPGGNTIAEMEEDMNLAFARIAAHVPAARLMHDVE